MNFANFIHYMHSMESGGDKAHIDIDSVSSSAAAVTNSMHISYIIHNNNNIRFVYFIENITFYEFSKISNYGSKLTMVGKVACGVVAVVAVLFGIFRYTPLLSSWGCHPGSHTPHKFLATKTPYSPPADLRTQHHDPGQVTSHSSIFIIMGKLNYIINDCNCRKV
jgi:hypothetical protein